MTKKAILDRCREILHGTPAQAEVTEDERRFLTAVLAHHPDATRWPDAQGAVTGFTAARWGGRYHTPCLYVHYENGEVWDFSFHKCVANMDADAVREVVALITGSPDV